MIKEKISCGLFGLATEIEKDLWSVMDNLKTSGFAAIEPLVCFHDDKALDQPDAVPSWLKAIMWKSEKVQQLLPDLKKRGLEISSAHVGFMFGSDPVDYVEEMIQISKETGICQFMTSMEFETKEKAEYAAEQLSLVNKELNKQGVSLGYHNHFMEFKKILVEGKEITAMEYFLQISDPCVKLQLDTGWEMYGGSDVLAFMDTYPERIISVHLKDFLAGYDTMERGDAFAAVGEGVLPTKQIIEKLSALSLMEYGLMIDQDAPAKGAILTDDLRKGMEFLKSLS